VLKVEAHEVDINPQYVESVEVETFVLRLGFESTFGEEGSGAGARGEDDYEMCMLW
jgi:hypothetical protein